jgi:hypothetical protein
MSCDRIAKARLALAHAALCLLLAACGGGGGDAGGSAPAPSPAPPTGPGTGGNPGTGTAPAGRLWHNNFALDVVTGTQVANLDNTAPSVVDPDLFAVPWPDGSQYVLTDYRPSRGETIITVKETGTRRTLLEVVYGGYARSPKPSPVSKDVVLMTIGPSSTEPADYAFLNLRTRSIVDRFSETTVSVGWLPDGRFLQVATNGQISLGTPGGARVAAGTLNLQGRRLGEVQVSAQGTQFIVTLTDASGTVPRRDLWVANLDGSQASRLTSTNITSYGHWSPDGRHIAFDADTGSLCTTAGCVGTCEIWFTASTSRNVNPLPSAPGLASAFQVRDQRGSSQRLGCEVLAWLR